MVASIEHYSRSGGSLGDMSRLMSVEWNNLSTHVLEAISSVHQPDRNLQAFQTNTASNYERQGMVSSSREGSKVLSSIRLTAMYER